MRKLFFLLPPPNFRSIGRCALSDHCHWHDRAIAAKRSPAENPITPKQTYCISTQCGLAQASGTKWLGPFFFLGNHRLRSC